MPLCVTVSVRPLAKVMPLLPVRPVLAVMLTSPVVALVVERLALRLTLPPYRLTGPSMLVTLPSVMSAVFTLLPMVRPVRLLLSARLLKSPAAVNALVAFSGVMLAAPVPSIWLVPVLPKEILEATRSRLPVCLAWPNVAVPPTDRLVAMPSEFAPSPLVPVSATVLLPVVYTEPPLPSMATPSLLLEPPEPPPVPVMLIWPEVA